MTITRRTLLAASATATAACATTSGAAARHDAIVVGAGVFGSWTAEHLRRAGKRVLLVDQMGPANARASSGGESRMTRTGYGSSAIYSQMAFDSLHEWKALSERASLPVFHNSGVLFFFSEPMLGYARDVIEVHRQLNLPIEQLDRAQMVRRWPQIEFGDAQFGLMEPHSGALMARRGVEETVARFVAAGGEYRLAHAAPGASGHDVMLNGQSTHADAIIYACGPWLGKVFPELLSQRITPSRQEIAFIATPDGSDAFEPHRLPGWAALSGGDLFYGFPNLEGRGFKLANDTRGPIFDPDTGDRRITDAGLASLRGFVERHFPALANRPFTEFRVCQYENSSNSDFLIDRHPTRHGTFLLGGGSGHGFKHGPEVGRTMANLVLGVREPDERFSLATKDITSTTSAAH